MPVYNELLKSTISGAKIKEILEDKSCEEIILSSSEDSSIHLRDFYP